MAWYYTCCEDCEYWLSQMPRLGQEKDNCYCAKLSQYKYAWNRACGHFTEYYLWYKEGSDSEQNNTQKFLLIKINCGFQFYDINKKQWQTDALYDKYRTEFFAQQKYKNNKVVKISEEKTNDIILSISKK